MQIDTLTGMANRIGQFFAAMPDREQALLDIVKHLKLFWEPRMRRQLLDHVDATQGAGLDPIVQQAIGRHRDVLA